MKTYLIIFAAFAFSLPILAQQTNITAHPQGGGYGEHKNGSHGERKFKERRKMSPEQQEKIQERRLQLMEKTLKEIGVTDEQKEKIVKLQLQQKEQMKVTFQKIEACKKKLSELERSGASEAEIYAAIDAVSDASAEQMKLLARNRMQMERILGREKFQLFMESARSKWKEHGRRGGEGMPPLPNREFSTTPPAPPVPPSK